MFFSVFFTLLFGYLGPVVHNGRMLAGGALAMAVGSFVMLLPHFLSKPYQLGPMPVDTCPTAGNYQLGPMPVDTCPTAGNYQLGSFVRRHVFCCR